MEYQPNLIEQIAYRDTWGGGLDTYLKWMHETLTLLRELLAESGSIYVHLDWRAASHTRVLMEELFGPDSFQREVIWRMGWVSGYKTMARNWIRNHDTLLFFVKNSARFTFNKKYIDYPEGYERWGGRKKGQGLAIEDIWGVHVGERINSLSVVSFANENLGYPNQKSESLVERIIEASSNEGDLVLDCFVGSGTTAAVAERLGRRWIAADLSRFAISTTRKRLLGLPGVKPFHVQNLGRYERQAWQRSELRQPYISFILELYRAQPVNGQTLLHGVKAGRMVHVGGVDSPVTMDDVARVVAEFGNAMGTGADAPSIAGVDILAWDFGLEVDTEARELARSSGIDLRLRRIPREAMDQKAVDAGDIHFFELAALELGLKVNRRAVTLTLDSFVMPLDGIPDEVRQKTEHWSQWIDYWAVDWDYRDDTFNNQWQSYRTRQEPGLQLSASHTYESGGERTIVVKVIDLLGNDTTRRLEAGL